jgi:hypothetical protein
MGKGSWFPNTAHCISFLLTHIWLLLVIAILSLTDSLSLYAFFTITIDICMSRSPGCYCGLTFHCGNYVHLAYDGYILQQASDIPVSSHPIGPREPRTIATALVTIIIPDLQMSWSSQWWWCPLTGEVNIVLPKEVSFEIFPGPIRRWWVFCFFYHNPF